MKMHLELPRQWTRWTFLTLVFDVAYVASLYSEAYWSGFLGIHQSWWVQLIRASVPLGGVLWLVGRAGTLYALHRRRWPVWSVVIAILLHMAVVELYAWGVAAAQHMGGIGELPLASDDWGRLLEVVSHGPGSEYSKMRLTTGGVLVTFAATLLSTKPASKMSSTRG